MPGVSGKLSTAKIDGTNLKGVQTSSAGGKVQELDASDAESGGFEVPDSGLRGMTVSLMIVIDVTTGDLTTLQEGAIITNLQIFADINAATPVREIPEFLVLEATYKGEVQGRCTYDVTGKSRGEYTLNDPN